MWNSVSISLFLYENRKKKLKEKKSWNSFEQCAKAILYEFFYMIEIKCEKMKRLCWGGHTNLA